MNLFGSWDIDMRKVKNLFVVTFVIFSSIGSTYNIAQSLQIGDRVQANTGSPLNVRSGAGTGYSVLFQAFNGETGTVTGGPTYATSYYWYKVRWDKNLQEGWSYQDGLLKIAQIGTVTLTSPVGGESWTSGTTHNITWNKNGNIEHCELQYTIDNGANWSIINSNATSPFSWSIPIVINSSQCKVKVLGFYGGANVYSISPSTFTISPAATIGTVT
ncbi:MAG: SH3 domain-containing protein, partial [Paludibacter sp.]